MSKTTKISNAQAAIDRSREASLRRLHNKRNAASHDINVETIRERTSLSFDTSKVLPDEDVSYLYINPNDHEGSVRYDDIVCRFQGKVVIEENSGRKTLSSLPIFNDSTVDNDCNTSAFFSDFLKIREDHPFFKQSNREFAIEMYVANTLPPVKTVESLFSMQHDWLKTLLPGEYLNSTMLLGSVTLLTALLKKQTRICFNPHRVIVMDLNILNVDSGGYIHRENEELPFLLKPKLIIWPGSRRKKVKTNSREAVFSHKVLLHEDTEYIVFPLGRFCHFGLFAVNIRKHHIYFFDSLRNYFKRRDRNFNSYYFCILFIIEKLFEMNDISFTANDWKCYDVSSVVQNQPIGTVDCGIYTLLYIFSILTKGNMNFPESFLQASYRDAFRLRLYRAFDLDFDELTLFDV
jgi:hypothetical protein